MYSDPDPPRFNNKITNQAYDKAGWIKRLATAEQASNDIKLLERRLAELKAPDAAVQVSLDGVTADLGWVEIEMGEKKKERRQRICIRFRHSAWKPLLEQNRVVRITAAECLGALIVGVDNELGWLIHAAATRAAME